MKIDNTGQGNCMYYAYSISLMYYLRKKQHPETAEFVFSQLKLNDLEKRRLNALLNDKSIVLFTTGQIKKIIEPILATAARKIAAEQTQLVSMNDLAASSVYAALCYGMVYLFQKKMLKDKSPEAHLLKSNSFNNPTFTEAEIYQSFPITSPMLKEHITLGYDAIMEALKTGWETQARATSERLTKEGEDTQNKLKKELAELDEGSEDPVILEKRISLTAKIDAEVMRHIKTPAEIQGDNFFKTQYLEKLIYNDTIKFFQNNNYRYLNQYIAHLNTNYVWGNEESLLLLHAHVQGTTKSQPVPGEFLFIPSHPIEMDIYVNGAHPTGTPLQNPDMVLNNEHNRHWTSLVEPPSSSIGHQLAPRSQNEEEKRIGLLTLSGFTACLEQLETYAAEDYKSPPLSDPKLFQMASELIEKRDLFIAKKSTISTETFCNESISIIDNNKLSLEQHSGFGDLLLTGV